VRTTASGTACRSAAGAEDMVGNLAEWALDWQAMVGNTRDLTARTAWPASYGSDGIWNISARALSGSTFENLPAALALGGSFLEGEGAGLFSVDYRNSPAHASASLGFRCVVPR
jgi:formylglycine-generating enzyme required for sulfatase activity